MSDEQRNMANEQQNTSNEPTGRSGTLAEQVQDMLQNIPPQVAADADALQKYLDALRALLETSKSLGLSQVKSIVRTSGVKWGNFPEFPGRDDYLDAWFVAFESLMLSHRIAETEWVEKFVESDKVGYEYKRRITDLKEPNYKDVRKHLLEVYGPACPLGFHRRALYNVRGTSREEVTSKLYDRLTLYNRAARDEGREEWTDKDLLYPFVDAFPEAVAKNLRCTIDQALLSTNPYRDLSSRAPQKQNNVQGEELVAAVEMKPHKPADVIAAVYNTVQKLSTDVAAMKKRPRSEGPCTGCGGGCRERSACPAQGKACSACGKIGHFARACRNAQDHQTNNNQKRPRPFRQAPGPSNQR